MSDKMKILIVNAFDIHGGAARAAYRLHQSLLMQNIDSQMLVQSKGCDDFTVIGPNAKLEQGFNLLKPTLDSIPVKLYKNRTSALFSPSWLFSRKVIDRINEMDPDIVHLQWINAGMIRIEDLPKIKASIVWTLHDMWAFTGGCHYDLGCGAYKDNCGSCPVLNSHSITDLSYKVLNRKKCSYSKIHDLTVIGVSRWLTNCAHESKLFKSVKTINFPNPIATMIFKPCNKATSRELWNFPQNKKIILFGALGSTSDPRKGFHELNDALQSLNRNDIVFVVFGATKPLNPPNLGCEVFYVGSLSDDVSLISLYSSVDVMIVPSRQEAFGQTASEAMACGTPVVAFNHTGLVDIVDHKENGYLAQALNTQDLADGIEWILDNEQYDELCLKAREKIERNFASSVVAEKYIELYRSVLSNKNKLDSDK